MTPNKQVVERSDGIVVCSRRDTAMDTRTGRDASVSQRISLGEIPSCSRLSEWDCHAEDLAARINKAIKSGR